MTIITDERLREIAAERRGGWLTPEYAALARELLLARAVVAVARPFANIVLMRDGNTNGIDAIEAPDLDITPNQVRAIRAALKAYDEATP